MAPDKLRFIKPTLIADTIYSISTNLDKRPKYDDLGLVRASYEMFEGEREMVLYCERLQTVKYRHPESMVAGRNGEVALGRRTEK